MKTCIFDLETFSLSADTGIILCCAYKEYGDKGPVKVIRADSFPEWKKERSNSRPICEKILDELHDFDIFIAHNGQRFDKPMLISFALKHDLRLFMRFAKFIDPVETARRYLRLTRNSLASVASFLGVKQKKTSIEWEHWRKAAYDGSRDSMDYIVEHCEADILVLEAVHQKMRKIVRDVNDRGSSF